MTRPKARSRKVPRSLELPPETVPRLPKRGPGRPRTISNPARMMRLANRYFDLCDRLGHPYLITELVLAIGLVDRRALRDYEKRPEFAATCRMIQERVCASYELRLSQGAGAGAIFVMKNMGWRDAAEMTHSNPDGSAMSNRLVIELVRPDPQATIDALPEAVSPGGGTTAYQAPADMEPTPEGLEP